MLDERTHAIIHLEPHQAARPQARGEGSDDRRSRAAALGALALGAAHTRSA
jgi:hypothetical protein